MREHKFDRGQLHRDIKRIDEAVDSAFGDKIIIKGSAGITCLDPLLLGHIDKPMLGEVSLAYFSNAKKGLEEVSGYFRADPTNGLEKADLEDRSYIYTVVKRALSNTGNRKFWDGVEAASYRLAEVYVGFSVQLREAAFTDTHLVSETSLGKADMGNGIRRLYDMMYKTMEAIYYAHNYDMPESAAQRFRAANIIKKDIESASSHNESYSGQIPNSSSKGYSWTHLNFSEVN